MSQSYVSERTAAPLRVFLFTDVRCIIWLGDSFRQLEDIRDDFFGETLCIWANKNDLIVFRRKNK